ncbi:uncharacterized protein LOC142336847 [Convolutriloba macropyga]|uniref:uncharacterized protein LOC142336847 n=1 Tax=Convolutriloba macropyga TaxID=536237 RepID=UPI003F51FB15
MSSELMTKFAILTVFLAAIFEKSEPTFCTRHSECPKDFFCLRYCCGTFCYTELECELAHERCVNAHIAYPIDTGRCHPSWEVQSVEKLKYYQRRNPQNVMG